MSEHLEHATFSFGDIPVRTAGTPDAPLFCAADVCAAIDIKDASDACSRLDQDEQELIRVETGSGSKHAIFVTESGLYSLVLTSRKPEAKAFKRWVTSEVLPSIRKTGGYAAKPLTIADQLLASAQLMVEHERRLASLEAAESNRVSAEQEAVASLRALPAPTVPCPDKPLRATINECVRAYAISCGGGEAFREAWRKLYQEFRDRHHFDAKARSRGRGRDPLDAVDEAGLLPQLYAVAIEVLRIERNP